MKPYSLAKNDLFGRYLVATKDLKEGELILRESPLMVGAQINAFAICFRCCVVLEPNHATICPACDIAPVCHAGCKGGRHPEAECGVLKQTQLTHKDLLGNPQVIMPLRCLLLRLYDSERWEEFLQLEAHLGERRDTYIWRLHRHGVERVLDELGCLNENDVVDELMQKVCGILDVNTFELRANVSKGNFVDPGQCLRGLFLTPALMAHDCTGNTHLAVDENFVMTVHASRLIPKDGIIYFNYTNGLLGTVERQRHLKEGKYFDCTCARCSDPTEFGTDLSALCCPRCKTGWVNCTEPLKGSCMTPWKCATCDSLYKGSLVNTTVNLCKEKINSCSFEEGEQVLEKLKLTFAPQHYLILELKQNLVSQTGITTDKKISLCQELLGVIETLEPGLSRHAGIARYELHNALVDLANRRYGSKEIKTNQFLSDLKEAEVLLSASIKTLVYEPRNSPEGRLAQRALTDLRVLRRTMSDLAQIVLLEPKKEQKKPRRQRKQK